MKADMICGLSQLFHLFVQTISFPNSITEMYQITQCNDNLSRIPTNSILTCHCKKTYSKETYLNNSQSREINHCPFPVQEANIGFKHRPLLLPRC